MRQGTAKGANAVAVRLSSHLRNVDLESGEVLDYVVWCDDVEVRSKCLLWVDGQGSVVL